jgi:hypothetical protein
LYSTGNVSTEQFEHATLGVLPYHHAGNSKAVKKTKMERCEKVCVVKAQTTRGGNIRKIKEFLKDKSLSKI